MRTLIPLDLHHLLILEIFSLSDKADVPLRRIILRQNEHASYRSMPDGMVVFTRQETVRLEELTVTTTGYFTFIESSNEK